MVCSSTWRDSLSDLDLVAQQVEHPVEPGLYIEGLEYFLLLLRLDVEVSGHQIGELTGIGDALHDCPELRHRLWQERYGLKGPLAQDQQPRFERRGISALFRQLVETGGQKGRPFR